MENTGRIKRSIAPDARRLLFQQNWKRAKAELQRISEVDRAHLVMLVERGILRPDRVGRLLSVIDDLRKSSFEPLRERPAPRGLFLKYEDYLIETAGSSIGGILQTGRSRNDLGATLFKLRLRRPFLRLLTEMFSLQGALLKAVGDSAVLRSLPLG